MSAPFSEPSAVRLRPVLGSLPAYVAGRPAPQIPGLTTFKISSNENPYPPLPSVLGVIAEAAAEINRYPDMTNTEVRAAIAAFVGREADQVVVGPGSTGVLAQIMGAACDAGDEIVFAWRSFEAYPILAQLAGATPVTVPLTASGEHDLDAMAAAVTGRTRLVLLCTPNNPTGTSLGEAAVRAFLRRLPSDVAVVMDEAYGEFSRDAGHADGLALQEEFPQVIALRTFSKAFGLAGLRVGYGVAHPAIAEALAKTAIPFGVNRLAQAAAIHSLGVVDELNERVDALVAERERVTAALAEQGWVLPDTQANFLYFPLGEASAAFDDACHEAGLVVRRFGAEGVRVSIGETEANDRLLALAREFRATVG